MTRQALVLIIAGLSVLLAACTAQTPASSFQQPPEATRSASSSVVPTLPASPEAADLGDLRRTLERAGLSVGAYSPDITKLDKEATPLFPGAPLHPYELAVGGTAVLAFAFHTSDQASRVVSRIDRKDPFPAIEFKGLPHVFLHDRAIVMFVEDSLDKASAPRDSRILSVLRSQLGTDYASAR